MNMSLFTMRILNAPDWDYHPLLVVIGKRNIPGESVGYSAQRSKKISFCTSLLGKSSDTRLKKQREKKENIKNQAGPSTDTWTKQKRDRFNRTLKSERIKYMCTAPLIPGYKTIK